MALIVTLNAEYHPDQVQAGSRPPSPPELYRSDAVRPPHCMSLIIAGLHPFGDNAPQTATLMPDRLRLGMDLTTDEP